MSLTKKSTIHNRRGVALILSMIFVLLFSTLAISMVTLSDNNAQISNNQRKVNYALSAAHSGLEVMRYYIAGLTTSDAVLPENRLTAIAASLQSDLATAGANNISTSYDYDAQTITIADVPLNPAINQTFNATISYGDDFDTLEIDIIGSGGEFSRQITVEFDFETVGSTVFDYGVATKGPLQMTGQTEIEGENLAIEGSVYIEGDNAAGDAFSITNKASVAGDVTVANENATYTAGSRTSVGGATGDEIADHIHIGADYVVFPEPDPSYFLTFATGNEIYDNGDWENDSVLENVTIKANTNPTFASNVTINGILFIETPNVVQFAGKAIVNGIIVGDGDITDDSGTNSISFAGQVVCNDMDALEGAQFDTIKEETGTFIVAPGFDLDFSGQALSMSGAIASNGISFSGQAGGTVNGSIINYSSVPMAMSGQSTLTFNRSGIESNPSGFSSNQTLVFQPSSYSESTP